MSERFHAWISKYALSVGIQQKPVKLCDAGMVATFDSWAQYFHGEGKDWHRTEESAIARAEEMRVAKIASLRKQIAKLEKLSFAKVKS